MTQGVSAAATPRLTIDPSQVSRQLTVTTGRASTGLSATAARRSRGSPAFGPSWSQASSAEPGVSSGLGSLAYSATSVPSPPFAHAIAFSGKRVNVRSMASGVAATRLAAFTAGG